MALKPCLGCGRQVDTSAAACPQCGRPKPTVKPTPKWLVAVVGIAMFGGIYKCIVGSEPEPSWKRAGLSGPVPAEPPPSPSPPLAVTAQALHSAYDQNEVSADQKYKGKRLVVEGVIRSIDKDMFDNVVLVLAAGDMFAGVHATLTRAEAPKAAELKKRQRVEVECVGSGKIINSAMLKDCAITATWK
jgi:tRNA_anti-like